MQTLSGSGGGYVGKILRVDLTTKTFSNTILDSDVLQNYLGGAGLAARILFDETPQGIDSFSPDNRLIFTTGPLRNC